MTVASQIFSNRILMVAFAAWFIAQILKIFFVYIDEKRFDITRIVGSGGMPSSHSSFVTALMVSVGKECGFDSSQFAISTVLAFIVMYDAAGVRRAAGKQAKILNTIIKDMHETGTIKEEKLKELIGHTPVEVLAGALVGIITAVVI